MRTYGGLLRSPDNEGLRKMSWRDCDIPPDVTQAFRRMAYTVRERGFTQYGAGTIVSVIRWHADVVYGPGRQYKVNQNLAIRLAQELVKDDKSFAGFFRFKDMEANKTHDAAF